MATVTLPGFGAPMIRAVDLVAGAFWTGVVGGTTIAGLALLGQGATGWPARGVTLAVAAGLLALIGWRLLAITGHARPAPADRRLVLVAAAGVLLTGLVRASWHSGDLIGAVMLAFFFGTAYGLVAAVIAAVILLPVLLAARAHLLPVSASGMRVIVTVIAMVVTGLFAALAIPGLTGAGLTALAVALAGVGSVLIAPADPENRREPL